MSLIDDFESSFQACLAPITNPISSHVLDNDELKANVDNIQRFLDISQQIESFFIRKRAILSEQKPDITLTEEITELKSEIKRKDALLNRYYEKLNVWSNTVNEALSGKSPINSNSGNNNVMMTESNVPTQIMPGQPQQPPIRMGHPTGMPGSMPINSNMQHVPSPIMRPNGVGNASGMMMGNVPTMGSATPHAQSSNTVYNPIQSMQYASNQNPLANLERTTAHIGMNDNRR